MDKKQIFHDLEFFIILFVGVFLISLPPLSPFIRHTRVAIFFLQKEIFDNASLHCCPHKDFACEEFKENNATFSRKTAVSFFSFMDYWRKVFTYRNVRIISLPCFLHQSNFLYCKSCGLPPFLLNLNAKSIFWQTT